MQQAHAGGQDEQGDQVGRIRAGPVVPPLQQADVGVEPAGQFKGRLRDDRGEGEKAGQGGFRLPGPPAPWATSSPAF